MTIIIAALLFVLCILISMVVAKLDDLNGMVRILMHTHKDICEAICTEESKVGFIQKMVAAFYERDFGNERKKITY